jgi:hypothetical protein
MKLAGLTPCRRQSQDWRNRRGPDDSSRPRAALAARSDDWSDRGMGQGEKRSGGCRRWPCRHYSSRQRHLLAPIARPGKIMAIGLNKADPRKTRSPGLVLQACEQRQCAFRAKPDTQSLPGGQLRDRTGARHR